MPSFNDVIAGSLAQSAQVQQIIDALKGTPSKGVPIALTAVNDTANYALTVQNDDPTNSRALSVLSASGGTLITADINGVTLGSPVNMPAGALSGSAIAAGSVTNNMLGPDVARANLLTNGGFEIWQRGNGPYTTNTTTADRWVIAALGGDTFSVARDTTNMDGAGACAAVTFTLSAGAGASSLYQSLVESTAQLVGRTVSVSLRVRTSTANAVRVALTDQSGANLAVSNFQTGSGAYQTLTTSLASALTSATTTLYIKVYFAVSCTAYLDNAMLVVGTQPANYVPLHPADDLARCLRYYEQIGVSGGTETVVRGWAGAAGEALDVALRFAAQKAVTPTVTKVGTWSVANCGQPTLNNGTIVGLRLEVIATGAGADTYALNGAAGTYITAEANP